MTLIELVVAIMIIGVGLAGLMATFTNVVKGSSEPLIRKQMLAIAEQMMEEITMKQFIGTAPVASATCARDTWIGLQDYSGYDSSKANCLSTGSAGTSIVYEVTGSSINDLNGYAVVVELTQPALTSTAGGSVPAANVIRIKVTVTHGSDTLELLGWRTNYAS